MGKNLHLSVCDNVPMCKILFYFLYNICILILAQIRAFPRLLWHNRIFHGVKVLLAFLLRLQTLGKCFELFPVNL